MTGRRRAAQPPGELGLPTRGGACGVVEMKRCQLCGAIKEEDDFLGACCGRCDKRVHDAHVDSAVGLV